MNLGGIQFNPLELPYIFFSSHEGKHESLFCASNSDGVLVDHSLFWEISASTLWVEKGHSKLFQLVRVTCEIKSTENLISSLLVLLSCKCSLSYL